MPPVGTIGCSPHLLVVDAEDECAGRKHGSRRHQHMLHSLGLVRRLTADEPDAFCDPVHPVDVGLAELAAVGVDGKTAAELDVAAADELLRRAPFAKPELLEL